MRTRHCIAALLMIALCTVPVCAQQDHGGTDTSPNWLASRLTAEAELAHYARYNAAGAKTRALGRRMTVAVDQWAADAHIQLPAPMNDSDRQWVRWLEGQQGDDFDSLYRSHF